MKMKLTVLALLVAVTPQTRAAISRAFRSDDFEIVWTANRTEAVEASARHQPDLLLLDLNQPLDRGWGTFESLRTLNPGVPVVVLTEHRAACEEVLGDQRGVVLQKPFDAAALEQTAQTLLKMRPAGVAPETGQQADVRRSIAESEKFREMLLERYKAPYVIPPSCRHWGINE